MKIVKRIILNGQSGVSLITVIIAIIVIILLAAISIYSGLNVTEQSIKSDFYYELSNVQESTDVRRIADKSKDPNMVYFDKIKIINAPNEFKSVSDNEMMGYVVDLNYIGANGCKYGTAYKDLDYINGNVTFGESDVYIFDATGTVYYVKGYMDSNGRIIYKLEGETTFAGPIIESVIFMLHTDKSKAMIAIEAYSRDGSDVTITVGGEPASYQENNKYYSEKSENGNYEIVATDIYNNNTVANIIITGIVKEGEIDNNPSTVPIINSLTAGEQLNRKITLTANAIDEDDGIIAYAFTKGEGMPASGWINIPNTKTTITPTYIVEETGRYYFWVNNEDNLVASQSIDVEIDMHENIISYFLKGGHWSDDTEKSQTKMDYDSIQLLSDVPIRAGYTFLGWSTNSSGTVVTYAPGATYNGETDLNLYAVWQANTNTPYKVEHYKEKLEGGYALADTENFTGTTDSMVVANALSYDGFVENNTTSLRVPKGNVEGDGSLVLKLYYDLKSFEVVLTGENGTVTGAGNYKYGSNVNINITPNKGYAFSNWTIINGTISGINLNTANASFTMPKENVSLKGTCSLVTYNITYNLNEGTETSNPTQYNVTSNFTLNEPTKEGYRFIGWSGTDISGTSKIVTINNMTGDRTYTANYRDLFTLTSMNTLPTYHSVSVKVESISDVKYQYSINNGTNWIDCQDLVSDNGLYITYINVSNNTTIKVRALKADNSVERTGEIEISNIIYETIANAPQIISPMKAVYQDGSTMVEANAFTNSMYDYCIDSSESTNSSSNWANAKTEDGSLWVWIPRFAYKIYYYTNESRTTISPTKTAYEKIFIKFLNGTSSTQCLLKSDNSTETLPEGYTIPSAFNRSGTEIKGFWISKYEASASTSNSSLGGGNIITTNAGNIEDLSVLSVADAKSWRGISYDNALLNATNMYPTYNSDLTSNAEWDATAILTQSAYGINISKITAGNSFTTGSGSSTTGNSTGVYDFGGNAWEYVKSVGSTQDISLIKYLDASINSYTNASSIIGKIVRGSVLNSGSNLPLNGGPDYRTGYRISLHIN